MTSIDSRLQSLQAAIAALPFFPTQHLQLDQPVVTIGHPDELDSAQQAQLDSTLQLLIPWKKGPFRIFGTEIDAEWRSDTKWARLLPHLDLRGKVVADIGCNNGYFMLRMAALQPQRIVGFEPYRKHKFAFDLLQGFAQLPNLAFESLGIESIDAYPIKFDVIFCLGILYHHTDPMGMLRKMSRSLRPGGRIYIDCQGIAGSDEVALVNAGRYLGAGGIWFLPTLPCLINWCRRADFKHVNVLFDGELTSSEQRTTAWAPIKSLDDFLDPGDHNKTIEGYPAPRRFYLEVAR